ncbi:MAG: hypothetical protein D6725_04190 [Planctomycetota bacterium]|nr:MAG: hypothetical protein D6725_04190 [Planctomycetota bacterium]
MTGSPEVFAELIGRNVVVDAASQYVYVGRLTRVEEQFLLLEDADVHDLRDTSTTRELYVLDSKRHGIRANRRRVWIRRDELVSISLLDDVME